MYGNGLKATFNPCPHIQTSFKNAPNAGGQREYDLKYSFTNLIKVQGN
jgi:hypothetical protein